jgi:signal transduction histidine kinase
METVIRKLPPKPRSIAFLAYLAGYLALHWASYVFVFADFRVTPWNPETGVSFLVAAVWGPVAWPALALANFLGEYTTGYSSDLRGALLRSALYATAYCTFGTIFGVWARTDRPGSLTQIIKLIVVSALAAILFGGLLVPAITWLTHIPSSRILSAIITSATGDLVGILSVAPLYIAWVARPFPSYHKQDLIQLSVGLLTIGAACFIVFGLDSTDQFKFFYLVLLPVVAFSLRHGFVGAAFSVFTSDVMMMAFIYGRDVAPWTATELQILMITLSATGLLLGSVASERSRLSTELVESHQRLNDAQSSLMHASRVMLINEMASAIAHEINQPLSAVRNYCRAIQRLLPSQQIDREKLGSLIAAAVEQVDAASGIVNDTRRFVKRETPAAGQASLADSVALCLRLLHQELLKNGIDVKTNISPDLWVLMQPVRLQQVVLNLLRNSIEAMGEHSKKQIEVYARRHDQDQILVTVKDTGTGIPEDIRAELFKPFMTTKKHGLGLGLSLSRSTIEEHGGDLWCDSSGPGEASFCFSVRELVNL